MPTPRPSLRPSLLSLLLVAAVTAALSACGAPAVLPEDDLFREASLALEDESYATAISSYKKLLEEYPFSDKAEVASLNIAYAHYLKEEYGEAIASFNDFERLYPVSPLLPFVSYTIGMCWLDQAKDGFRDPTASDEALRQFRKVANEFPRTMYADLSVFRQQQAMENLAAHEIVVGDYYRERKNYQAAEGRYRFVMSEYPATENAQRASGKLLQLQAVASLSAVPLTQGAPLVESSPTLAPAPGQEAAHIDANAPITGTAPVPAHDDQPQAPEQPAPARPELPPSDASLSPAEQAPETTF